MIFDFGHGVSSESFLLLEGTVEEEAAKSGMFCNFSNFCFVSHRISVCRSSNRSINRGMCFVSRRATRSSTRVVIEQRADQVASGVR